MPDAFHALEETVTRDVTRALAEDVGAGDLTAALIPADRTSHARRFTQSRCKRKVERSINYPPKRSRRYVAGVNDG